MKRYLSFLLLIVLVFGACSKNKVKITTEQKLAMADKYYANEKYSKAAVLYDEISFERKSAATAYATMRLADSYFAMNKFTDARLKYHQFIDGFPDHVNAADAYFRVALSLFEESLKPSHDQNETVAAIEAFGVFLDRYPKDSRFDKALEYIRRAQYKLIEKKYQNGYIYYKMKDYSAALMYFDEVIALGNTDALDRQSLYYSALLHRRQKNHEAARAAYTRLKSRYPGSKEVQKLYSEFE